MSAWKKAMFYLGLGPDDAYDDEPLEPERPPVRAQRPASSSSYGGSDEGSGTVRAIPARPVAREPQAPPRSAPPVDRDQPAVTIRPRPSGSSSVRTVASSASRPHTVRPRRFDQAQEVADRFKQGQPVIVNLQDVDRDLSRRLIDFASGLCYGLDANMEKVANGVYLLTPVNVSVSAEDRQALAEHGLLD